MRQNDRKISVIIGNPPYNANQQNENDNNKNREYPAIDKRIKDTYVKESTAQKTKVYDMYARFLRWATDRLNENGIVAFITNSSFINSKGFDGFRKTVANEFDYIYTIDLGGDIRAGDTTGNVFNIMIGVAITFLVKKSTPPNPPFQGGELKGGCQIFYNSLINFNSGQEKRDYLAKTKFDSLNFTHITPDKNNNWINLTNNDFESLIPLVDKKNKQTIFELYSNGVATNRDEWVYDFDLENLIAKSKFFIDEYNHEVNRWIEYKKDHNYQDIKQESNPVVDNFLGERNLIKWSKMIKRDKLRKEKLGIFYQEDLRKAHYRPFVAKYLYFGYIPIDIRGAQPLLFNNTNSVNQVICFANNEQTDFLILAINTLCDLNFCARGATCFALYTYDEGGNRQENITDWGLQQFREYYQPSPPQPPSLSERGGRRLPSSCGRGVGGEGEITKEDIFYYIYGVLHNPKYRQKYELNLKREFPRIPFYDDFNQWKNWGQKLMDLHINYETIKPYSVKRIDFTPPTPPFQGGVRGGKGGWGVIKPKLKVDKTKNQILIDDVTTLTEIPPEVWEYKLGNRSAIEWILDQYKEKKAKDQTIAEKFNNYCFADYKETVIDLIMRVTTVSLETMKIIKEIEKSDFSN